MKNRNLQLLPIFTFLILSCVASSVFASDAGRQSLRGLQGIYVSVENIGSQIKRDGLSVEQIKADIERKLNKAGIMNLSKSYH